MKKRLFLLPSMAVNNIRKNGSTYFPYIGVSIFAMFTFFVFDLIRKNDVMRTIPKAAYANGLVAVGFVLLMLIMVPFLYYTNSFLIKRRKQELGMYSILGMEKKHIGVMMFWESLIVYGIVMAGAIVLGLLFSRLIFLLLLNLAGLPVEAHFSVSPVAIVDALVFYAFVTGLNLFVNLVQVGKARPVELMSGSRKGEKEPKHIWFFGFAGLLALGAGYYMAVASKMDGMIFANFFLAVFLVVLGTYFLFTSGSIALLRFLKRRKRFYYRTENFVTVSGMLYRMKKSAASLSNICIFGTMTMITLICTVSLWLCTDSIIQLSYPHSFSASFLGNQDEAALWAQLEEIARDTGVTYNDYVCSSFVQVTACREGSRFSPKSSESAPGYPDWYIVKLMDAAAYGRMEGQAVELEPGEALVFSTGPDYGNDEIFIGETTWRVKEELTRSRIARKVEADEFNNWYLVILPDEAALGQAAAVFGLNLSENRLFKMEVSPEGETEAVEAFCREADAQFRQVEGYAGCRDNRENMESEEGMYGGLLFIGIFFGSIFLICLLIIMYYKQITEGFEDQKNFEIMQKVGMSDAEIRKTIRKQILLVFTLPLAGAVCHTLIGMRMVMLLMAAIRCVETGVILGCTAGICIVFAVFYSICYKRTSATYYRIVKKMG
ncbi:bacitracin export permease protein BceB [Lachnospiraceae bacterium]|nr:bacitracin export permease protein BceB [Lachnospiraceae bacterium]